MSFLEWLNANQHGYLGVGEPADTITKCAITARLGQWPDGTREEIEEYIKKNCEPWAQFPLKQLTNCWALYEKSTSVPPVSGT